MSYGWKRNEFSELKGRTITKIEQVGDDQLLFTLENGATARLFHSQDCCENVTLNEVIGDLDDLIGSPILQADLETNSTDDPPEYPDSWTWSFYKLATIKGYVTLRWLGESNGYYSEEVAFQINEPETAA